MPKTRPSIYPEARSGPLGSEHAQYATPRKYGSKSDSSSINRIILTGIILIALGALAVIWLMSSVGATYF